MNKWLRISIEYANQWSYLDDLFRIYPTIPDGIRDINPEIWGKIEKNFNGHNNVELLKALLELDLFPIKDSYVAYLRRDKTALERNTQTVNRLCGRLYELGLQEIWKSCSQPKETNRQIGPLFKKWINNGCLGMEPVEIDAFRDGADNAILNASDATMKQFAADVLGYTRVRKGLDFVARFNGKYVFGEAKFLTDFGGHQNAQFEDAMATVVLSNKKAISVAILDGVLYIPTHNKLYPAMLSFGVENFTFEIVEQCDNAHLTEREKYWTDFYKA